MFKKNNSIKPKKRQLNRLSKFKFVNREHLIEIFKKKLLKRKHNSTNLLLFCGVGGHGKTALAEKLLDISSYRLSNEKKRGFSVLIDFSESNFKIDPLRFLVSIRNKFASLDSSVSFPVFDSALIVYYSEMRLYDTVPPLTRPVYEKAFKDIAKDVITSSIDNLIDRVPIINTLIKKGINFIIDKDHEKILFETREYHNELIVNGDFVSSSTIRNDLAWFLAKDINYWLENYRNKNAGIDVSSAIFFDEYENLFKQTNYNLETSIEIEKYIKVLVLELDHTLVTFFSRTKPDWGREWVDILEKGHCQLTGLNEKSARELIHSAHSLPDDIIEKILFNARESEESSNYYFPLLITLQLQNITNLKNDNIKLDAGLLILKGINFVQRKYELIDRLLRDYDPTHRSMIERLCYCDEFNQNLFISISEEFHINLNINEYSNFCQNSVIRELENGSYTVMNVISDSLKINFEEDLQRNFQIETLHFLLKYHEKRAKVPKNLRFSNENLKHLSIAAELKLQLDSENYFHWLVHWNEYLRKGLFLIQGLTFWKNGLNNCLNSSLKDKREIIDYRIVLACFYCSLENNHKAKELIEQNKVEGKNLSSMDISKLILYSPNQESIDYWFNKHHLPAHLPLSETKQFYTQKIINSVLLNPNCDENREKYLNLFKKLKLKKDAHTINAIIKYTKGFEKSINILSKEDDVEFTNYTYSHLLEKSETVDDDMQVLRLMKKHKYSPKIFHYNILLKTYSDSKVNEMLKRYGFNAPEIKTVITYTTCVLNVNSFTEAMKLCNEMCRKLIKPDQYFIKVLFDKCENIEHVLSVFEIVSIHANSVSIAWKNIQNHILTITDLNKLLTLLRKIQKTSSRAFIRNVLNRLIVQFKNNQGDEKFHINEIAKILTYESVETQYVFLELLIINESVYENAQLYLKEVENTYIKPSIGIINKMISLCQSYSNSINWLVYCDNNNIEVEESILINVIQQAKTINDADDVISKILDRSYYINYNMLLKLALTLQNKQLDDSNEVEIFVWLSGLDRYYDINRCEVIITLLILEEEEQRISLKKELKDLNYQLSEVCMHHLFSSEINFSDSLDWLNEYKNQGNLITKNILIKCATRIEKINDAEVIYKLLHKNDLDIGINYFQACINALCKNYSADELKNWLNKRLLDITLVAESGIASYVRNNRINDAIKFALLNPTSAPACKLYREYFDLCEIKLKNYIIMNKDVFKSKLALVFLYFENNLNDKANLILHEIKNKVTDKDLIKLDEYMN